MNADDFTVQLLALHDTAVEMDDYSAAPRLLELYRRAAAGEDLEVLRVDLVELTEALDNEADWMEITGLDPRAPQPARRPWQWWSTGAKVRWACEEQLVEARVRSTNEHGNPEIVLVAPARTAAGRTVSAGDVWTAFPDSIHPL
ncbi:hypothetical protein [Streptacidiphilus cavernicola]|uniref:Uncharacterized protein n=1 Tax=Streptacidiphilus cavernicola TaxID=3342716 RepID=A0ABV6VYP8_9ACTN